MSEIITGWFQSTEVKTFLSVTLYVTQLFQHIYTRLHSWFSTDVVTEYHIGYADLGSWSVECVSLHRFISWNCRFESIYAHGIFFLFLCVLLAAYVTNWSLIRSSRAVCVISEPQQTVTLALSLSAAPQKESNINFTYRHSNSNRRLLPAPRQCRCFSRVDPFYRTYFIICCACRNQSYLNGNT